MTEIKILNVNAEVTNLGTISIKYLPLLRFKNSTEWYPASLLSDTIEDAISAIESYKGVTAAKVIEFGVPDLYIWNNNG